MPLMVDLESGSQLRRLKCRVRVPRDQFSQVLDRRQGKGVSMGIARDSILGLWGSARVFGQ